MNGTQKLLLLGGLAVWAAVTSPSSQQLKEKKEYPLPEKIEVLETSLPHIENKSRKFVRLKDIDFRKDLYIKTERYTYIKDEDWLPSRLVGHALSIPGKVIFWDWDYAWGQDEQKARASLSMLENNTNIKDLTLRLNHNEAFYDAYRMLTEKKLRERNNILARLLIGLPLSFGNEIWAEFSRGSYYNPLTQTAVCYSNIESITAHEVGHHKDFQRFTSDWEYMLVRPFVPVMLYQEWKASKNAKDFLSADDQYQFNRYLMPAFLTYLIASYYMCKRFFLGKEDKEKDND